jgi:hypothetical protein
MPGQARISWHVEGDWIVLTIESPGVPAYELRANLPVLRRVARVQRLQSASAGASIAPGLQKMIDKAHLPPWLAARFHDEGDALQQASFAATMYVKGYGRVASFGLPTNQTALKTLLNPSAAFWQSTPGRKKDRDWGVTNAPKLHTSTHWTLGPLEAITKIPILGPVFKAAASPLTTAIHLAEGQPINQAALGLLKDNVGAVKSVAPLATTIISMVPGVGTGVAAAIAAGAALAEGKTITAALEDAVRGAIPGGAIAQAGFDMARKVASGENVGKAALETARAQLPPIAQKAFDVGLAVASGKKMQSAIAAAVTSFAPAELQQVLDVGKKAVESTQGLATLAKSLPSDIARQGLTLASGVLAHQGANETQIRAMRSKLTGDALKGFDAALKSQEAHFPWLTNVTQQTAIQNVAKQVASSAAHAVHAAAVAKPPAPRAAALKPSEPFTPVGTHARAAQAVPGWHGLAAGVGARHGAHAHPARARAERAFIAANRIIEADEQGELPIGVTIAQLQRLCQLPQFRDAATRGLYVLGGVQQWRAGLHAEQRAGCCGEATILGAVGQASIVGGVEMPPAPIPVERLIAAGVRPGTF